MDKHFNKLYKTLGTPTYLTGSAKTLFDAYRNHKFTPAIRFQDAINFLSKQVPYTLHRRGIENFPHNRVYTKFIGDIVSVDLAELPAFKDKNDGYRYIFCFIDCFSKKAYAEPMKDKYAETALKAFKKILSKIDYKIHNLSVDNGSEFLKPFSTFCKQNKINLYQVEGSKKSSIVERFILSLKQRLFRHIRLIGVHRWVDILQDTLKSYNESYHRSIRMKPNQVSDKNSHQVYKTLFPGRRVKYPKKFRIGDTVRILKTINRMTQKAYEGRWSLSVYRVKKIKYPIRGSYPMYQLEIAYDKQNFGNYWFYGKQLQKVDEKTFADKDTEYELEVLKRSGKKALIKWLDYDGKPEWIHASKLLWKKQ